MQPDIPEEDELDEIAFEVVKLDHESNHDGNEIPYEREKKEQPLGWLWVCGLVLYDDMSSLFLVTAPIFITLPKMLWSSGGGR